MYSTQLLGDTADCVATNSTHESLLIREVRINATSFTQLEKPGGVAMTTTEAIQALNGAIDAWTATANGSVYRYGGTTTAQDAVCGSSGYSVVRAVDESYCTPIPPETTCSSGVTGNEQRKCGDPGEQFRITIYGRPGSQSVRQWTVGEPNGFTSLDLEALLVHEIGHANNISHPTAAYGVMTTGSSNWRQRDLYQLFGILFVQ